MDEPCDRRNGSLVAPRTPDTPGHRPPFGNISAEVTQPSMELKKRNVLRKTVACTDCRCRCRGWRLKAHRKAVAQPSHHTQQYHGSPATLSPSVARKTGSDPCNQEPGLPREPNAGSTVKSTRNATASRVTGTDCHRFHPWSSSGLGRRRLVPH